MPRKRREDLVAFSIRLPRRLSDTIRERAMRHRRSLNQEITWLLEQALALLEEHERGDEQLSR